ncbi:MAG: threonine ammonia-lyase [Microthrixaceae bacterium]
MTDPEISESGPTFAASFEDVQAAAERIRPHVHNTPVLTSAAIDSLAGATVHLKSEHLQRAGSFKARGAHNKLLSLDDAERERRVVTVSSGNHAGALACAGARLGVEVDVFMPEDAPELKARAAESYGATIHRFNRFTDDRQELEDEFVARTGAVPAPPFDDPQVIAAQGTVALEFHDQAELDTLVVPVSGGGLMAGCAIASRHLAPGCRIVGVEPAGAADTVMSFEAGHPVAVDRPDTIADGLAVHAPGNLTFPIMFEFVDEIVTVADSAITEAMVVLFERTKQVVEPSGAAALAAVLDGLVTGQRIGVVLSGGNIDVPRLCHLTG